MPLSQSEALYEHLSAIGLPARLVVVENAGHSFRQAGAAEIEPNMQAIQRLVIEFFNRYLRRYLRR